MARPDPVLNRLKGLHPIAIDLSLDRLRRLLADLGHPERKLPPVIHVAGTNGKGSTIAFARAILEADGRTVHAYTSPHLVRFNERIRLAGELVSDEALTTILEEVEAINDGRPITLFEVTTAAALLAFSRVPADALLLEVGLGGRFDATNVVDRPAATVIARISYDHRDFLGESIEGIAAEKAGIMKPGVPAVWAPQPDPRVTATFERVAGEVGAKPVAWTATPVPGGFRFEGVGRTLDLPLPGLVGAHQIVNAGGAIAAILAGAPFPVSDAAIAKGVSDAEWPARLQRLVRGPLVEAPPPDWELWLDGGHNDSAGEVLAARAAAWAAESDPKPLLLIHGMLTTKRPAEFLGPLLPFIRRWRGVGIPGEAVAFTAEALTDAARDLGVSDAKAATGPEDALRSLIETEPGPARVLICGSLYLAGEILSVNG